MESKRQPLFPVTSTGTDSTAGKNCLFPAASASTHDSCPQDKDEDLDWLELKSFLPTAALLADEEQKSQHQASTVPPKREVESAESEDVSSEEEEGHTSTSHLKRSPSPQHDNDSEGPPPEKRKKKKKTHSNEKAKDKKHKKKKKKHKHKKSRSSSPKKGNNDREADGEVEFWNQQTGKTFVEEMPGLQPEFAFRIDRKAEKSLWNYESIYKGHIARYSRLSDKCLGNLDISLREETAKRKDVSDRYYSKEKRKVVRARGQTVRPDKDVDTRSHQYLSIREKDVNPLSTLSSGGHSGVQWKKENEASCDTANPLGILDAATSLYTQGVGLPAKEVHGESSELKEDLFEKVAFYNRQLNKNPENVRLWLEFVSFQDLVFQDSKFSAQSVANHRLRDTFQPPRACIEKKLAILGKALETNPSCLELKIAKLELQQDVVDSTTLAKEWDGLLFTHSGDVRLWRHYLMFQQSRLSTFSVSRMVKLYHRCFKTLSPISEGKVKVVKVSENLEEGMIGVFGQYCDFLLQCGFKEKAVASYQALTEFNLFRPPSLNLTPTQDCVAVFESFWDSSVPRFGESGAKGWAAWVEGSKGGVAARESVGQGVCTEEEQEAILTQASPVWQKWLQIERLREHAHWLPWRPDTSKGETEEDCEDFDRIVLYDDVAPVLFRLQKSRSCLQIVELMIEFLGLQQMEERSLAGCHGNRVLEFEQLRLYAVHQVAAASGLNIGFSSDSSWCPRAEVLGFVEEVVRQSAAYFSGHRRSSMACMLLQLQREGHGCRDMKDLSPDAVKDARKFGKNLLKEVQNRNDLMVWCAYIRSEWAFGKVKDAVSMLNTALAMFSSSTAHDDHVSMAGLCSLYCTLAEIHLSFHPLELVRCEGRQKVCPHTSPTPAKGRGEKIISAFQHMLDKTKFAPSKGEPVPPAQVLRMRRKFESTVTNLQDADALLTNAAAQEYLVHLTTCFAMFELCAAGIQDALHVFDSVLQAVHKRKSSSASQINSRASQVSCEVSTETSQLTCEALEKNIWQRLIVLLKNYMSVEVMPLNKIRTQLNVALGSFPDSSILLRQLIDLEAQTHMAGRLRRYFEAATRDPRSVYPVLFEVLAEMNRHYKLQQAMRPESDHQKEGCVTETVVDTGTVHRVRAACERGLQHKVTQHCPLLWRLYLRFEAVFGSHDRAKGIFYRALQSCPWAKVLYLDGAEVFGEEQLQELVDLMMEKELRVQIPMEEVELLLNSEPQNAGVEENDEDEEDENEEFENRASAAPGYVPDTGMIKEV